MTAAWCPRPASSALHLFRSNIQGQKSAGNTSCGVVALWKEGWYEKKQKKKIEDTGGED